MLVARMSLASSPGFKFQPEDKALDLLYPTMNDPLTDSIDQWLNWDVFDISDQDDKSNNEKDFFENFIDLFDGEGLSTGKGRLSSISQPARQEQSPPQPWRKGLWCLNQNEAPSPRNLIEKKRPLKPGHTLSAPVINTATFKVLTQPLHNNLSQNPRSPPATPSNKGTKRLATSPKPATLRHNPYVRQPFSREVTLSPSPMSANLQCNGNMAYQDTWQQDFHNFHLQVPGDSLPLSPPSSGRAVQQENNTSLNAANVAHNASIMRSPALAMPAHSMDHPVPSIEDWASAIDPGLSDPNYMPTGLNMVSSPLEQPALAIQSSSQPQSQPIPTWTDSTFNSPVDSEYPYPLNSNIAFATQPRSWQSPPPARVNQPRSPLAHQSHYPFIAAPTPHRPAHHLLHTSPTLQTSGLGIQYPDFDTGQIHQTMYADQSSSAALYSPSEHTYSAYQPTYKPIIEPPPNPIFSEASPFTTPRRKHHVFSPSRSPSPSISPTNISRSNRQRSPTRSHTPSHNRRKSIGKPGPISHPPKAPKTPRTPKTPTAGFGAVDFVNFTPKDSKKLLSDVAPSGSSKTRARREQEAREKRRRLSEAAMRAVRRAGGDVDALEKAIMA